MCDIKLDIIPNRRESKEKIGKILCVLHTNFHKRICVGKEKDAYVAGASLDPWLDAVATRPARIFGKDFKI